MTHLFGLPVYFSMARKLSANDILWRWPAICVLFQCRLGIDTPCRIAVQFSEWCWRSGFNIDGCGIMACVQCVNGFCRIKFELLFFILLRNHDSQNYQIYSICLCRFKKNAEQIITFDELFILQSDLTFLFFNFSSTQVVHRNVFIQFQNFTVFFSPPFVSVLS